MPTPAKEILLERPALPDGPVPRSPGPPRAHRIAGSKHTDLVPPTRCRGTHHHSRPTAACRRTVARGPLPAHWHAAPARGRGEA